MAKQNMLYTYNELLFILEEILSCATLWMNLEDIMLSERSQSQKGKYRIILPMWGI